jgi:DNA-binding response OmpR family regulator
MRILVVEDEKKVAKVLRDGLEQTFGSEYEAFRAAVPRWIPRMTTWRSE